MTHLKLHSRSQPSQLAYFRHYVKLFEILEHAMRTIYLIDKSKMNVGLAGPDWEQVIGASREQSTAF